MVLPVKERTWPRAVVFDLDGTLIDSLPDIVAALNAAIGDFGFDPIDPLTVRHFVGKGAKNSLTSAFLHHGEAASEDLVDAAYDRFVAHYAAAPTGHGSVYPNVTQTLDDLSRDGIALAVCTNKPRQSTDQVLEGFGLSRYFEAVLGGDDRTYRKPDPRHLVDVLDLVGVANKDAVLVGDSDNDIDAARSAGVASVAVTFGYSKRPATELGADVVIDDFAQLSGAIAALSPS